MVEMFRGCELLTSLNISKFNCDQIKETKDMKDMLENFKNLNIKKIVHNDFKIRGQIIIDLNN